MPRNAYRTQALSHHVTDKVTIGAHHIADARDYLTSATTPEMLDPITLAQGGKRDILTLLRQGIQQGHLTDLPHHPPDALLTALYDKTVGLGVLETFLRDERISQINVLGPDRILVQVDGLWRPVTDPRKWFRDVAELRLVAANIARRQNKELSPYVEPILDLRFGHPPLRIHINMTERQHGISLFIRRARSQPFTIQQLIAWQDVDRAVADWIIEAAQRLIGCLIIGPVGTGKTVLLETYIDQMPHVAIVVVDDAGDCNPSHPYCMCADLPAASYTKQHGDGLTLASLTRAALREAQVLVVAETRGAEEAGVLINDAPSMKAVATTAHGETAVSGLSRLVGKALQSSTYRGSSATAVRADLTRAFPLVIEMQSAGYLRFVNAIYHNQGWADGQWQLRPLVKATLEATGGIYWTVLDNDLDKIAPESVLDRMSRVAVPYEAEDPRQLAKQAMAAMAAEKWRQAADLWSRLVAMTPDNDHACVQLRHTLTQLGLDTDLKQEASNAIQMMQSAVAHYRWDDANKLVEQIRQRPSLSVFVRQESPLPLAQIKAGLEAVAQLQRKRGEIQQMLPTDLPWQQFIRALQELGTIDIPRLPHPLRQEAKALHARLLAKIVAVAPAANVLTYKEKLDQLVGADKARHLTSMVQTGVPEESV